MQRVLVIGNGGAGKSSFSRHLAAKLAIPLIHLDSHYWRANWEPTPTPEWKEKVSNLIKQDAWIMDGNYAGTMKERMGAADTIVYLDVPRLLCLYRVWRRRLSGKRADPIPGCKDKVDLAFMQWIWSYRKKNHPSIMNALKEHAQTKKTVILKNRTDMTRFIGSASAG